MRGPSNEGAESTFGFLLAVFESARPTGRTAFGWDRTAISLAGRDSIRDMIDFPKAASSYGPLTAA